MSLHGAPELLYIVGAFATSEKYWHELIKIFKYLPNLEKSDSFYFGFAINYKEQHSKNTAFFFQFTNFFIF